jgi:hypothetical protein
MYAVVRINTFEPETLAAAEDDISAFNAVHAAQPGFLGSVAVDLQPGRQLVVNLWQSEEHAESGRLAVGPEAARFLNPTIRSEFLGAGPASSGGPGLTQHLGLPLG